MWLFGIAESLSYDFRTILHFADNMWCDAPKSITHFGAAVAAAAAVTAQQVSQKGLQSPVVVMAAVAVAFFTFHHCFICL